jgi:hypothetical protein
MAVQGSGTSPDALVLESLQRQAVSCARIGSPLYAALFDGLAADYVSGGVTTRLLNGVSLLPIHDALPLRLAATLHRQALGGEATDLAAMYPSCGGTWDGTDPTPAFLETAQAQPEVVADGLRRNVQTNEVARAVVLHAGMCWVSDRWSLPLHTLEFGASGGLLSNWDRFSYDTGTSAGGDPLSVLRFGPEWYTDQPPRLRPNVVVAGRAASDVSPIDVTSPDGRLAMLSFVWPDQLMRFERLDAAIDIATQHGIDVAGADAGAWVDEQLRERRPGATSVVFHSIVWQYLSRDTRQQLRATLQRAGTRATEDTPLVWLRMEPATADHADLRATVWPGGDEHHLADVGYHGADVRWLA